MEKLVLIDGHSILSRAFYGIPMLTNSEGIHTNAVYGFLNILFKIMEEENPEYLLVAFDLKEPTFRHEMYKEYKGTRKPMPRELHEQVPIVKEVLSAMGIKIIEKAGFEADDVLGTLAKKYDKDNYKVTLVSGDKDMLQLATDNILIRIPKTKRGATEVEDYYAKDVVEELGVTPKEFIDVKALMGDPSDNIPGVPGIGKVTATKIIAEYKSLENVYENIANIKPPKAKSSLENNQDLAKMSKELATIYTDVPLEFDISESKVGNFLTDEAYLIFKKLEFKSILSRFDTSNSHESEIEENFTVVDSIKKIDEIFKNAMTRDLVGYNGFYNDGKLHGISITISEKEIYYIPLQDIEEKDILEKLRALFTSKTKIAMIELKEQLHYLDLDYRDNIFDLEIAAYLMNPLKDTYNYDDLARDYLNMTVPSRMDLLGKLDFIKGLTEKPDEFNGKS